MGPAPLVLGRGDPEAAGGRGGLAARPDAQLGQQRRDVVLDGLGRQRQPGGDLGVAEPLGEQAEHLDLPAGEAGRVGGRGPGRAAGDVPVAALPEPAAQPLGRLPGSETVQQGQRLQLGLVLVAAGQRQGPLVGAAELPPRVAAARQSPASSSRYGSATFAGTDAGVPATPSQKASSPANQGCAAATASSNTRAASSATRCSFQTLATKGFHSRTIKYSNL